MIKERKIGGGAFGTHITPLIAAVLATKGDIIELGIGDYSTPLLHEIVKHQRSIGSTRKIHSFESDPNWLANFKDLRTDWHLVEAVHDWDKLEIQKNCSVIFIDHAPADRRVIDIQKYRHNAGIIVVHDTEKAKYYGYEPTISSFKYRYDYERYSKKTTLLSEFINVKNIIR